MGSVASAFAAVGIAINVSSVLTSNKFEEKIENKIEKFGENKKTLEMDLKYANNKMNAYLKQKYNEKIKEFDKKIKKIDEMKNDYDWLKCLPFLLIANQTKTEKENNSAYELYKKSAEIKSDNFAVNYFMGLLLSEYCYEEPQLDDAEKYLLKCSDNFNIRKNQKENPYNDPTLMIEIYNALGSIHGKKGIMYEKDFNKNEAKRCFEQSKEYLLKLDEMKNPGMKSAKTYSNLGITYFHLGKYEDGIYRFEQAITNDSKTIIGDKNYYFHKTTYNNLAFEKSDCKKRAYIDAEQYKKNMQFPMVKFYLYNWKRIILRRLEWRREV